MGVNFFKFFMVISDIVVVIVYGKGWVNNVWEVYVSGNC